MRGRSQVTAHSRKAVKLTVTVGETWSAIVFRVGRGAKIKSGSLPHHRSPPETTGKQQGEYQTAAQRQLVAKEEVLVSRGPPERSSPCRQICDIPFRVCR